MGFAFLHFSLETCGGFLSAPMCRCRPGSQEGPHPQQDEGSGVQMWMVVPGCPHRGGAPVAPGEGGGAIQTPRLRPLRLRVHCPPRRTRTLGDAAC